MLCRWERRTSRIGRVGPQQRTNGDELDMEAHYDAEMERILEGRGVWTSTMMLLLLLVARRMEVIRIQVWRCYRKF